MAIDDGLVVLPAPSITTAPPSPRRAASFGLTVLFAATAFVGASLLFVVQPLIAKLILPSYGGSATVWSTSSLFFQVLLLLAYGYAHWTTTRLGQRWQPRAHLVLLLLPLVALPVAIPSDAAPGADASPVLWLLRTLVLVIGLPFAVVATTGPLLQRWYSWGDSHRADDPYFLFAASNLGSFGGLLAYPLLIEPNLSLASQRTAWSAGFVVFVVLTGTCALTVRRPDAMPSLPAYPAAGPVSRLSHRQVLTWTALAFLPSSLMLGVTAHISTDVAAIPLLWVVPLAIYLATFVVAFSRSSRVTSVRVTQAAVASAFVVVVGSLAAGAIPVAPVIGANLLMLALVAFAAHSRLAAERPAPDHLTAYFMVIAAGGALGGLLNGMAAPMVFDRVLEYPIALIAVPLLLAGLASRDTWLVRQLRANRVRAALVVTLIALVPLALWLAVWGGPRHSVSVAALLLVALAAGWWMTQVPKAMVVGLVVLYAVATLGASRGVLEQTRTFFGSYTVEAHDGVHELVHGTTVHGTQLRGPAQRGAPTTYYSRSGPLGDAFALEDRQDIAAVGLGTGTVAAYGQAGQSMTFFEIDPEIVRMAGDPDLFSYVEDSAADIEMVVGDGRLRLAQEAPASFDLVILDAFSSDSIPVHLLTEEGMEVYADRLTRDGLLMVHISNRVFDLEPVVANAAEHLGWAAAIGHGEGTSTGATPSTWIALSPDADTIDQLRSRAGWGALDDRRVRWTDDYSSILSVLDW